MCTCRFSAVAVSHVNRITFVRAGRRYCIRLRVCFPRIFQVLRENSRQVFHGFVSIVELYSNVVGLRGGFVAAFEYFVGVKSKGRYTVSLLHDDGRCCWSHSRGNTTAVLKFDLLYSDESPKLVLYHVEHSCPSTFLYEIRREEECANFCFASVLSRD